MADWDFFGKISFVLHEIINSILLIRFYAAFLVPKSVKFRRPLLYGCLGLTYFIVQHFIYVYALNNLPEYGSMSEFAAVFCSPVIFMTIVYFLSRVFFQKNTYLQIFLACSFITVLEIGYFILPALQYIIYVISKMRLFQQNIPLEIALHLTFYTAICFLSLKSIINSLSPRKQALDISELLYLILPCLLGLALVSVMKLLPYKIDVAGSWTRAAAIPFFEGLIPLSGIIFLLSLTASVKLFQKMTRLRIDERERIVLQKQTEQMREQIKDVNSIYTGIRSMRHDIKGHIANLQLLVNAVMEGKPGVKEELEKYFGQLSGTLDKLDYTFQTENPITDVIIQQKYMEAVNREIKFSADFIYPARLNIDVYDLAVILNNALENAAEACVSLPQADRFINLYSYVKGEMFFIEVKNSFAAKISIDEHTNLPISSKPDKLAHGMGLANIRRCAGKYYGDIDWSQEENIFLLTIMLQGKN